jgi:hypothetical protein
VVTHTRSGDLVGKALRGNKVPLPDGHYTLLPGPPQSYRKNSNKPYFCAVGKKTEKGRFRKVTVIYHITHDPNFYPHGIFD